MGESPHNPLAPYDGAIQETAKVGQRLIDVIKDYLEPWRLNRLGKEEAKRMKRQTSAIADGIVRIAEAESKGDEIKALAELKIREWNRQQQNRAAVVVEAKKYLPQSVPEESPDSDWINDFFRAVENISEQQLRTVFAKLLADEIGKPGTFSRRAISIAREMRAGDVSRLEEACSLVWFLDVSGPGGGFIPNFIFENAFPHLLSSDDVVLLADMGLLRIHFGLRVFPPAGSVLRYGSHLFRVGDKKNLGIPAITMTTAADELCRVFEKHEHADYLERSLGFFRFPGNAIEFSPAT